MTTTPGKQREIYQFIKQQILSGAYKTNDRLPLEAELAEQFGAARSVVRESLSALKNEGYVSSKRGRNGGYIVSNHGLDVLVCRLMDQLITGQVTLRQAAEMRLKLEVDACRTGIDKVTPELIARLYELDAQLCASQSKEEITNLNAQFHSLIGSMAGNKLQGIFLDIALKFVGKAAELLSESDHCIHLHSVDEHLPIIQNIEAHNADKACFYIEQHILRAVDRLEKQKEVWMIHKLQDSLIKQS